MLELLSTANDVNCDNIGVSASHGIMLLSDWLLCTYVINAQDKLT